MALGALLAPVALQAEPPSREHAHDIARLPGDENGLHRLIVKFKDEADSAEGTRNTPSGRERATTLNAAGYRHRGSRQALKLSYLKSISAQSHVMLSSTPLNRAEMTALTRDIAQDPRVEYVEIDERVYPLFVPDDTDYAAQQWNLKEPTTDPGGANLPGAWDQLASSVNGSGVTVAFLDTGYRPHADLLANIVAGYDFVSADVDGTFGTANDGDGRDANAEDPGNWNDTDPYMGAPCDRTSSSWHGTRVAGIIGAVGNNHAGVIGVAYGATLLPVRVLGRCGGYTSDIAAGIQWAAGLPVAGVATNTAHVAKVINMSMGSPGTCSTTFQTAITAATNAGSVIVVATGNGASDTTISAPANCNGVIAVTAHTRLGDTANYANIGAGTSISAPGGGDGTQRLPGDGGAVYSTSNTGITTPGADSYSGYIGTSFAAPHVSGAAALLLQIRPTLSPASVLHYLTSTARTYPTGTYCVGRAGCGAGLLDVYSAVHALITGQAAVNRAPVLFPIFTQTVAAGGSLQFTATGTDADGDLVSYSASGVPSGASFNGVTGVFNWGYALPGTYTMVITPTDGVTAGSPQSVTIAVTGSLPVASTGGGGGGSVDWVELIAALMLTVGSWALRRNLSKTPSPQHRVQHDGHNPSYSARYVRRKINGKTS